MRFLLRWIRTSIFIGIILSWAFFLLIWLPAWVYDRFGGYPLSVLVFIVFCLVFALPFADTDDGDTHP